MMAGFVGLGPLTSLSGKNLSDADYLLPDSFVAIYFEDLPGFLKSWETSPLARLMEEPSIQRFFAPAEKPDPDTAWGTFTKSIQELQFLDILGSFDGPMAFTIGFETAMFGEGSDSPPMLIAGKIRDEADFASMMYDILERQKKEGQDLEARVENYLGVDLHILRKRNEETDEREDADTWAVVDGYAFFGSRIESVKRMLEQYQSSAPAQRPDGWQTNQDRIGFGGAFLFIDIRPIEPLMRDGFVEGFQMGSNNQLSEAMAESFYQAVGLNALETIAISLSFESDRARVGASGTFAERRGIWDVIAFTDSSFPQPEFATSTFVQNSSYAISLAEGYDALMHLLEEGSPEVRQAAQAQLQQLQNQIGVDFRVDLLEGLGDQIWAAETFRSEPEPGAELSQEHLETDTVFAFELTNQQRVEISLNTLRNLGLAAFEAREFLGVTIYDSKLQLGGKSSANRNAHLSYTLAEGWLFLGIGSSSTLERVITQLYDPAPSLWESPRVASVLKGSDEAPQGFVYTKMDSLVDVLLSVLKGELFKLKDEPNGLYDLSQLPDKEEILPHLADVISRIYFDDDGFHLLVELYAETD